VAEDGGVAAEVPPPEAGADDGDVRSAGAFFRRQKRPAQCWRDTEDAEEIAGDARGADHFGLASSGQGELLRSAGVNAGLGVGAGGGAKLIHVDGRGAARQHNEFLRVRIPERAQQHGADDGEECRVGADAKRNREHDGRGKAGTPGDHPRGEAKVPPQ
jgi:hypothetical protein